MSNKELLQENQYHFPYHHLSHEEDGAIFVFRHLFWGLVHHTYISYIVEKINQLSFDSLADVGCGDGRIISELEKSGTSKSLTGVDISKRSIRFAEAFCNSKSFSVHDITNAPLDTSVDVIVSSEVIEHITPDLVPTYIRNIHSSLKSKGTLLITTPTTNVPVNTKHYQHFTSEMFDKLLNEGFTQIEYVYLNKVNWHSKLLEKILANRFFLSNSVTLNRFILNNYNKYLLVAKKGTGSRMLVKAVKL